MTQDPEHQKSRCPKCGADRGEPCINLGGKEAGKVHYGRPEWSAKVIPEMDPDWWPADRQPLKWWEMDRPDLTWRTLRVRPGAIKAELLRREAGALGPEEYSAAQGNWGPCDQCSHWMIRDSGLPTTCVVCRSAA